MHEMLKPTEADVARLKDDTPVLMVLIDTEEEFDWSQPLARENIGTTTIAVSGLSVGTIIWVIRAGSLAASVLTWLPAWQFIDPLPVLQASLNSDEDESLSEIIDRCDDSPENATSTE